MIPLIFPPHPCLRPPLGEPLECRDEFWRQKTRIAGLPDGEEIMTLAFFVWTQYTGVWQTDRRMESWTDGQTRYERYSVAPVKKE